VAPGVKKPAAVASGPSSLGRSICRLSLHIPSAGPSGHRVPQQNSWEYVVGRLKQAFREQLELDKRGSFVLDIDMVVRPDRREQLDELANLSQEFGGYAELRKESEDG
jgi:hypothetical protein